MPDTGTAYNWRLPLGTDIFKTGFQAVRDMATDIAATITAMKGGEARYIVATSAAIACLGTGNGVRIPFAGTPEYTHADVSADGTSQIFTLNKAGLWLIDASARVGNVPANVRTQLSIADDTATNTFRAQGSQTGATATTLDFMVGLTKRFAAGQKISVFMYTNAGTQPSLDTASAAVASRSSVALTWLRA